MFGLSLGNSDSKAYDQRKQLHALGDYSNAADASGKNSTVNITDGGAIAGNVLVANNALQTAQTITKEIGDQFRGSQQDALGAVKTVVSGFGSALEGLKKTELTGGSSLIFDNLKYWPVLPITLVVLAWLKQGGNKNG